MKEAHREQTHVLEDTKSFVEQVRESMAAQKAEFQASQSALDRAFSEYKAEMEGKLAGLEEQLAVTNANLDQTTQELEAAQDNNARLERDASALNASLDYYTSKVAEQEQTIQSLHIELRAGAGCELDLLRGVAAVVHEHQRADLELAAVLHRHGAAHSVLRFGRGGPSATAATTAGGECGRGRSDQGEGREELRDARRARGA